MMMGFFFFFGALDEKTSTHVHRGGSLNTSFSHISYHNEHVKRLGLKLGYVV